MSGFVTGLKNRLKTHCKRGHEFNNGNTYLMKGNNGKRSCRKCHLLFQMRRYWKLKGKNVSIDTLISNQGVFNA